MTSASVRRNRARGYWVAPTWKPVYGDEVLVPVEGSVSLWDHQTPIGITGGVQTEAVFVHLEYLAPERGGKGAMRVRSITATPGRFPTFYGASESR